MSRGAKIGLGVVVVLALLVFVVVPMVIGIFAKDKVLAGIQDAIGAPVKSSGVSVNLLPPGATISNLEVGNPDPAANNQYVAKINSLSVSVSWGSVFGSDTHVTGCTINGLTANISVDEGGVSSLARLIDAMPPTTRKTNLPIDSLVLKHAVANVFLAPSKKTVNVSADQPDGTLKIDYASVSDLVLSPPGQALGKEFWSTVYVQDVAMTAPGIGIEKDNSGLRDGVFLGRLDANFAQSPTEGQPIKVKMVALSGLEIAQVYSTPGVEPAARRASWVIPMGLKPSAKQGKANGIPELLVDAVTIKNSKLETRGVDASGKPAFWRLNDLKGDAANLAFGPGVAAPAAGHITLNSTSESSSGAGNFSLEFKEITGSYPNWTFPTSSYKLDGMAASAFSVPAQHSTGSAIKSGTVSMEFSGPARNGQLQMDGSITLSSDLEVTGTVNNQIAKIVRGQPLKTVRVRGTLEKPEIQFPDAFAGLAGKMFSGIITGGPMGVMDSVGGFMGSSVDQGVREASKGLEKGQELLKKVPGVNKIFGK